jgi:SAM-dependent methyltransferase
VDESPSAPAPVAAVPSPRSFGQRLRRARAIGWSNAARVAARRVLGATPVPAFAAVRAELSGACALEVGGPSAVFREREPVPLYPLIRQLDLIDFSEQTLWRDRATAEGLPPGRRLVGEATDLGGIPAAAYDLLLASHVLEHTANPLRALDEWRRVVRPGGLLILVVPDKRHTFDHRRPLTTVAHMVDDRARAQAESDRTHREEVLALHDLAKDPDAGSPAEFRRRIDENVRWRSMHHHVFGPENLRGLLEHAGLGVVGVDTAVPFHLIAIAHVGTGPTVPPSPRSP